MQPAADRVMFLMGRVTTDDSTALPNDVLIERICNNRVLQQVYASLRGDFSLQLGSRTDPLVDAGGGSSSPPGGAVSDSTMGIPRDDLKNCELRASASGFHYGAIDLLTLDPSGETVNVGVIVMQRSTKIKGTTLNITPYKAPKDARKAFEKGLGAENGGKLENARKDFEQAVAIYPKYLNAWFQLGAVLQKENQNDAARNAYLQATSIDPKFLPPYLSLSLMAYQARNWPEVLKLTSHLLDLNPLNQTAVTGYVLDLDPLNYAEAYFYNAVANYNLDRMAEAEKSALAADRVDLRTRFPQLHLLLAEFSARKGNYARAIVELQTYLQLAPHANNAVQVRERLAALEKMSPPVAAPAGDKPDRR
jgi:tetratricopeptide (TPR) repeat protein